MRKQRSIRSVRRGKAGLVLLLGLAVWGCGRSTATVSGHVHYQGSPLTAGMVIFYGPNHQVANAFIKADGSYTATNVPLGEVKVAVTTPGALFKGMKKGHSTTQNAKTVSLPVKYHDPEQSGLELTVTSNSQPFEIELK